MIFAFDVHECLLSGSELDAIKLVKKELNKRFEMKDLDEAKMCIGLQITRNRSASNLTKTQSYHTCSVLERFQMSKCHHSPTSMEHFRNVISE